MTELPLELYRAEQVRELDRIAIEECGIDALTLMNRAGRAAFDGLRLLWPAANRLVVLCGPGNNGGDGYVVARLAHEAGLQAMVLRIAGVREPGGSAGQAREAALTAGIPEAIFSPTMLAGQDLLVDGLLGTGLSGEVTGDFRRAIEALNAAPAPVFALDIPSGLGADTGTVLGAAVKAEATITFIGLKQGLLTGDGPEQCGKLRFDTLDVPSSVYATIEPSARRIGAGALTASLKPRPRNAHKGCYGHVLVVGGDRGMAGAARMAAEAAGRVGAGLVSIATRRQHAAWISAVHPEAMAHGVEAGSDLSPLLERATVIAIGPGLGRDAWGRQMLARVLETGKPLVMDADALNALSAEPVCRGQWVLTPHPGEAGRLLNSGAGEVQTDRFEATRKIQQRYGGVVVLKGSGTLVADENNHIAVCSAGNPGMASGGMGDLLTGVIAGLLAQGLSLAEAARVGVCLHSTAGDRAAAEAGERGLIASDLIPQMRRLVNP
ncbi:NAD(P)H-hydrate dehydratase [Thiohalomonas denitrificans]|uniref:NAD(P)H-hydrate dehydratase n=1 Tax=Thiohalomonas denitrificans TaxID=415747 RepID=UPI0026EF909C|nr:NAD(P)H-hydrate dehydratase [Thiohalomonas denitrificans]